jgi:DNA-directed RNA polymerase subunit alpha
MIGELDPKITALELSPKYGKFSIEPLERGFGHTMGNAFRRVLLSHIPGAAVTDVRIAGALHEFSTLPGIVEDVMEIVLNVKELAIKVHPGENPDAATEERILRIDASGETKVIGADVICPPDVEILNPEAHIAELSSPDAHLEMELWVEIGKGYRPTEERDGSRRTSGIIPVDALFSPIKRAAYAVEPTRLGHRTDLDRLILEVWGNGTVLPDEALKIAARVLQSYIGIFLGTVEAEEAVSAAGEETARESNRWLDTPIEDVDFSVRTFNCLKKEGINTLGDLVRYTEAELLAIRNFGKRSLDEVIEKLTQFDLSLREPDSNEPG